MWRKEKKTHHGQLNSDVAWQAPLSHVCTDKDVCWLPSAGEIVPSSARCWERVMGGCSEGGEGSFWVGREESG